MSLRRRCVRLFQSRTTENGSFVFILYIIIPHPSYLVKGFNQILMFVNNYFTIRAGDKRSLRRIGGLKCQYLSLVRVPVKRDKRPRVHFMRPSAQICASARSLLSPLFGGHGEARLRSYIIKIWSFFLAPFVRFVQTQTLSLRPSGASSRRKPFPCAPLSLGSRRALRTHANLCLAHRYRSARAVRFVQTQTLSSFWSISAFSGCRRVT